MDPNRRPPQANVEGSLDDAKERGMSGIVACSGCRSTSGTLVGKHFQCNTDDCKYRQKTVVQANPWARRTLDVIENA